MYASKGHGHAMKAMDTARSTGKDFFLLLGIAIDYC